MKPYITATLIAITSVTQAQTFNDALRYSAVQYGGTARFSAMGSSMGALGADLSSISVNPGGAAFFRKDEFSFTTSLNFINVSSNYNGVVIKDSKVNPSLNHLGYASANILSDTNNKWKSFTLGFNYNRNNNFNRNISINGPGSGSSLGDDFLMHADGIVSTKLDPFTTQLAWNAYLLDTVPGKKGTTYFVNKPTQGINQEKYVSATGALSELNGFLAGNYDDKLYIGASIGGQYVNYIEKSTIKESKNDKDTTSVIDKLSYTENLNTSGRGWFLNIGAIYKPASFIRIGAALRTPTVFNLKDIYSTSITTNFTNKFVKPNESFTYSSPDNTFDYSLTTPLKANLSLGFVINKIGLLNVDYEYIDYKKAHLGPSKSFATSNKEISKQGTSTQNIRIGAEVRLDSRFSLRGGVALYGEAFNQNIKLNAYRTNYTGGIGYRTKRFIVDGAIVYASNNQNYYIYDQTLVNATQVSTASVGAIITLGLRF
jgi:long-subunit fatty acid transport protein